MDDGSCQAPRDPTHFGSEVTKIGGESAGGIATPGSGTGGHLAVSKRYAD